MKRHLTGTENTNVVNMGNPRIIQQRERSAVVRGKNGEPSHINNRFRVTNPLAHQQDKKKTIVRNLERKFKRISFQLPASQDDNLPSYEDFI